MSTSPERRILTNEEHLADERALDDATLAIWDDEEVDGDLANRLVGRGIVERYNYCESNGGGWKWTLTSDGQDIRLDILSERGLPA